MTKFDMGAAWDDTLNLLRSHTALTGTIAAVFLFLPSLAVAWFGPVPIEPAEGADFGAVMAALSANVSQMLPYQLILGILTIVGSLGILRLWLSRSATSVGEALLFGLMLLPTMIAVQILTGLMVGLGFILLIIPGFYLVGRFTAVAPLVADRGEKNPLAAIRGSWDLTRGNGWSIFFFLFLVTVVIVIAAVIIGVVFGIAASGDSAAGRMLGGFVEAAFGAIGTVVTIAVTASVYRQLAISGAGR